MKRALRLLKRMRACEKKVVCVTVESKCTLLWVEVALR